MKKLKGLKDILLLQAVVMIYTMASVCSKFAAGEEPMSLNFLLFYCADIAFLGIYAICWQQMIKKFELSIAYANRSVALLWSLLWSILVFREALSLKQVMGVLLVLLGTVIINSKGKNEELQKACPAEALGKEQTDEL